MPDNFPLRVGDAYIISYNGPMQLIEISDTDMLSFKRPGRSAELLCTSNVAILRPVCDRDWGVWQRYYADAKQPEALADLGRWHRQSEQKNRN